MCTRHLKSNFLAISFAILALFAGSEVSRGQDPSAPASLQAELVAGAELTLDRARSSVAQTESASWALSKTGIVDQASSTVTWTIDAAPDGGTNKQLIITGRVRVENTGNRPATIGNLVVQLEHKPNSQWRTLASDVANATQGDAATIAKIVRAGNSGANVVKIRENAASGPLTILNGSISSPIPAGDSVTLRFSAAFNNSILNLPVNRKIRARVIVTYGKAASGNETASNVDIDGDGSINAFEARVRPRGLGRKRFRARPRPPRR